jgi:hypothetical protein
MLACALVIWGVTMQCNFMNAAKAVIPKPPEAEEKQSPTSPDRATWILAIGGEGRDYAPSFTQTKDGYVVVGMSSSYGLGDGGGNQGGSHDLIAIKLDNNGNLMWSRTIGGPADERGSYSVTETRDGGYLLTGSTASYGAAGLDILIVKINGQGDLDWSVTIGGAGNEGGMTTLETDGGYIVVGSTDSFGAGKKDLLVVQLSPAREI